jgi:hypothetical protein
VTLGFSLRGRTNRKAINIATGTDCERPDGLGKPARSMAGTVGRFVVIPPMYHTFCPWQQSRQYRSHHGIAPWCGEEKRTATYVGHRRVCRTVLQRSHRIMEFGYLRGPPNPQPPAMRWLLSSSECFFPYLWKTSKDL